MTNPRDIVTFCQGMENAERTEMIKGIESQFKWQSVAQVAQMMYPSYTSGGLVSEEALDMVKSGQISGGLELMRLQNQTTQSPSFGMTTSQQAALAFAWLILNGLNR